MPQTKETASRQLAIIAATLGPICLLTLSIFIFDDYVHHSIDWQLTVAACILALLIITIAAANLVLRSTPVSYTHLTLPTNREV